MTTVDVRKQSQVADGGASSPVFTPFTITEWDRERLTEFWPPIEEPDEYIIPWQPVISTDKTLEKTSQIESALNQLTVILLPHPNEVIDYLLRYTDILDILLPVCQTTLEHFRANAQLFLEVYHDPEIEDEYLSLYVRQENYDKNIMQVIKRIRTAYKKEHVTSSGRLLVTTDFQPPQ